MRKARKHIVAAPTPKLKAKRMNPLRTHSGGVGGVRNKKTPAVMPKSRSVDQTRKGETKKDVSMLQGMRFK